MRTNLLALLLVGCGLPPATSIESPASKVAVAQSRLQGCDVEVFRLPNAIAASPQGVAFGFTNRVGDVVQRFVGVGCDLQEDLSRGVAGTLIDVDDHEQLYVWPREASNEGVLPTKLDSDFGDLIVRETRNGDLTTVASAGRGIWTFGISPAGNTLWVTACGPTGVFTVGDLQTPLLEPGERFQWQVQPSVLTDDATFWWVNGAKNLVRTGPGGDTELGSVIFGNEEATLARCGSKVCGRLSTSIVVWNAAGQLERTIETGPHDAVTANSHGLYVLLTAGVLRFIPWPDETH